MAAVSLMCGLQAAAARANQQLLWPPAHLGVSHNGVLALVRIVLLGTNQILRFVPWPVSREHLDSEPLRWAVTQLNRPGRLPKRGSPITQPGPFDANTGLQPK